MFSLSSRGSFSKTEKFLNAMMKLDLSRVLDSCGQMGVEALSRATPVETGLASHSWSYEVSRSRGNYRISWINTDTENGFPVVIALQYGHGTGTGGWVAGRDFINPAIKPIFDQIQERVWKAVTSA